MKETCIPHPPGESLILIRAWQVEACGGNHCAAALLNFFEHWHNMKLDNQQQAKSLNDVAEKHGEPRAQEESLLQWHTLDALVKGVLDLYGRSLVQSSVKLLESLGFISIKNNPNPSYKWDKTHHYLFHPEAVIAWLRAHRGLDTDYHPRTPVKSDQLKIDDRESKNSPSIVQKETIDATKNNLAIPKITTKRKEIPPEKANAFSSPQEEDGHPQECQNLFEEELAPQTHPRRRVPIPDGIPEWSDTLPWPNALSLAALYNAMKPDDWALVETVSGSRLKKCHKYLNAYPRKDWWLRVMENLPKWTWLQQHLGRQHKTFDWLLKEGQKDGVDNCLKLAEGSVLLQSSEPKPRRDANGLEFSEAY